MVNFGVTTPLFGGDPVRIWTPAMMSASMRMETGSDLETPPPPLPGYVPLASFRGAAAESLSSWSSTSTMTTTMRTINSILASVNGTEQIKRRVTYLADGATPSAMRAAAARQATGPGRPPAPQRTILKKSKRNPYRKLRGVETKMTKAKNGKVWKFPTTIKEFEAKDGNENAFNDFWNLVENSTRKYEFENYFCDFWKMVDETKDEIVDLMDFWRLAEGRHKKKSGKEIYPAVFWRLVEKEQKQVDDAELCATFWRMVEGPKQIGKDFWESGVKAFWELIYQDQDDFNSPESLVREFFEMVENKKVPQKPEYEAAAAQFWRMVERKKKSNVSFVADSLGHIYHKLKGYEMTKPCIGYFSELTFVRDFFNMIQKIPETSEKQLFVVDNKGRIFKNHKGYKMVKPKIEDAKEAQYVGEFFKMVKSVQEKENFAPESYHGNFWQMIKNSEETEEGKKTKEDFHGEFWKTIEFIEGLRLKRETMRKYSESAREAKRSKAQEQEVENGVNPQAQIALYFLSKENPFVQKSPMGRTRTFSSSSNSSLYGVKEEEEDEVFAAAVDDPLPPPPTTPRCRKTSAPRYESAMMGSRAAAAAAIVTAAAMAKSRRLKATAQQCHKQNLVAYEKKNRNSGMRSKRIPCIVATGVNNDRKCGRKNSW